MRTTYLFEVKVESEHDEETVKRVLDNLINAGLGDAARTVEMHSHDTGGEGYGVDGCDDEPADADIALEMNIHSPVRIMIEG